MKRRLAIFFVATLVSIFGTVACGGGEEQQGGGQQQEELEQRVEQLEQTVQQQQEEVQSLREVQAEQGQEDIQRPGEETTGR